MTLLLLLTACKGELSTIPTESDTDTDTDTDSDTDSDTDTDPVPLDVELVVVPGQPLLRVGETMQLRTRVLDDLGGSRTVTGDTTWSGGSAVATLTPDGLITAAEPGFVGLGASFGGWDLHPALTVVEAGELIDSLSLIPSEPTAALGTQVGFAAWATTDGGASGDVGASCTWSSSDTAVAVAAAGGVFTTLAEGSTQVRADCADGFSGVTPLTVAPAGPAILSVEEIHTTLITNDRFRVDARVLNSGSLSAPVNVDFHLHEDTAPTEAPDVRISLPSLGLANSIWVSTEHTFTGTRPADLTTWVISDAAGLEGDPDVAHAPVSLPDDVTADVRVEYDSITVFGPTDAGVIFTVYNDGPSDLTDLTVYFDVDNPTATVLSDVDIVSSERSQVIPSLAANTSYLWLFDYDQVPFDHPWTSCAYVFVDGYSDTDPSNNIACDEFPEY